MHKGIPVTSVERTLLDLAELLEFGELQLAYERAERLRRIDHRKLADLIERSNGRSGIAKLRELACYDPTPAIEAKEGLEVSFFHLIERSRLPPYSRNVVIAGYEVDAYWHEANLVIELQSYAWHHDRDAFERDHAKLARLRLAGCEVLALTHDQVTREGDWVLGAIAQLLRVEL